MFTISKQAKNPQLAVDLALFVTQAKYELDLCIKGGCLIGNIKGMDDPFWSSTPANLVQKSTLLAATQLDNAVVGYNSAPPTSKWSRLQDAFAQQQGALFTGDMTAEDFLAAVEADWNKILSEG